MPGGAIEDVVDAREAVAVLPTERLEAEITALAGHRRNRTVGS